MNVDFTHPISLPPSRALFWLIALRLAAAGRGWFVPPSLSGQLERLNGMYAYVIRDQYGRIRYILPADPWAD